MRRRYERSLGNIFRLYQSLADDWRVYDRSLVTGSQVVARGTACDGVRLPTNHLGSDAAKGRDRSTNGHGQNGYRRHGLKPDPHVIFTTPGLVDAAMQKAAQQAVRRQKLLGESIAVWRDGKVVIMPPEEIEVPELPGEDAQA